MNHIYGILLDFFTVSNCKITAKSNSVVSQFSSCPVKRGVEFNDLITAVIPPFGSKEFCVL